MSEFRRSHHNFYGSNMSNSKRLLINNINSNSDLYEILPNKFNINKNETFTFGLNDRIINNNSKNEINSSRFHSENNSKIENNSVSNFPLNNCNSFIIEIKKLKLEIARLNEVINSKNKLIQEYQNITELSKKKINELINEISTIKKNNNLLDNTLQNNDKNKDKNKDKNNENKNKNNENKNKDKNNENKNKDKENKNINNNDNNDNNDNNNGNNNIINKNEKLLRSKLNEVEENYHKLFLENYDLKAQLLHNDLLCQQYKKEIEKIKNCSCIYCKQASKSISNKENPKNLKENKSNENICQNYSRNKSETCNKSTPVIKTENNFSCGSRNNFNYPKTGKYNNFYDKFSCKTLPNYVKKNEKNKTNANFRTASSFRNGRQIDDVIRYSNQLLQNMKNNMIKDNNNII